MEIPEFNIKKVVNGVTTDVLINTISHPFNTIKVNKHIGLKTRISPKILSRGLMLSNMSEIVHSSIFYVIFDGFTKPESPLLKSLAGGTIANIVTHPLSMRCKLKQINKNVRIKSIKDNYKGLSYSIAKTVPGIGITYTLRDYTHAFLPPNLRPLGSAVSAFTSIILTHPLDVLYTLKTTNTNITRNKLFVGLKENIIEKNMSITTKMIILDILNYLHH